MENGLIVYRREEQIVTAGFQDRELVSINVCGNAANPYLPGSLWIGRVEKLVPGIHAAFVRVEGSGADNWYLPIDKAKAVLCKQTHADGWLHVGDEIVVQVEREASKTKPISLVSDFSLTGVNLVLMHGKSGIYFSSKIDNEAFVAEWKERFHEYRKSTFAIMLRTNAQFASAESILCEFEALYAAYGKLCTEFVSRTVGTCLRKGLPSYLCELRDAYTAFFDEIVTDDELIFTEIQAFLKEYRPEQAQVLRKFDVSLTSLSAVHGMEARIKELMAKRVWLKSGAYLVIEYTEAMTVVDVNSGKATAGNKLNKEGFLTCNLEAAREVLRQIRLRNLSGIIMVDFIDMKEPADRKTLMDMLHALAKQDPIRTTIVDMTKLNLVEITRMKKKRPLYEELTGKISSFS